MNNANFSPDRENERITVGKSKIRADIHDRTFEFAVRIVRLVGFLEDRSLSHRSIRNQILRSGTSIGANMEEASGAQSKRDFVHKCNIALKEARETRYWIKLLTRTIEGSAGISNRFNELESESDQITRIIGKIIVNAKKSGDYRGANDRDG